jgi:hypothetical protein
MSVISVVIPVSHSKHRARGVGVIHLRATKIGAGKIRFAQVGVGEAGAGVRAAVSVTAAEFQPL